MAEESVASGSGQSSNETQLVAEYKDGKLQIVEVAPYDKYAKSNDNSESYILPDILNSNQSDKGTLQLDLLNLTLVKCGEEGSESYRLVANADSGSSDLSGENTVACVLQSSDGEDGDGQESYVMVEGDQGPLVFLQPATVQAKQTEQQQSPKKNNQVSHVKASLTPELLEKAKQIEQAKAKAILAQTIPRSGRGRKRANPLPPAKELLASPNFKLFLYSCKMCSFRCNAVRDLTKHKNECHNSGRGGSRGGARGVITLQCARCPYRAPDRNFLTKHVNEKHAQDEEETQNLYYSDSISLDSEEVAAADVLVCGACGFESSSRSTFREHIETAHGATTV